MAITSHRAAVPDRPAAIQLPATIAGPAAPAYLISAHEAYTVDQLCDRFDCHPHTIERWVLRPVDPQTGQRVAGCPMIRVGDTKVIIGAVLLHWLTEHSSPDDLSLMPHGARKSHSRRTTVKSQKTA